MRSIYSMGQTSATKRPYQGAIIELRFEIGHYGEFLRRLFAYNSNMIIKYK